jgi:hypothetical protein
MARASRLIVMTDQSGLRPIRPRLRLKRRQKRLATTVTVSVVLVTLITLLLTSGGGHATPKTAPVSVASTSTSVPTTGPTTTTTNPAGSLPQTQALPTSTSSHFLSEMAALWTGITQNSPAAAQSAFFPENAYVQVKTLPSDTSDYRVRLLYQYGLDIGAANALLGAGASQATLVSVNVPSQYAHWVPPGATCTNQVGYFEVANARIVYREDGVEHSFGIASLISWRGQWYVVHLGAIMRTTDTGIVLDPEAGPGSSPSAVEC